MLKLNFTTQTPLHISNGNNLSYGIDYIINEDRFAKFNMNLLSEYLVKNKVFDLTREYSFKDFIRVIEDNRNHFSKEVFEYEIETNSSFLEHCRNERTVGKKNVMEFVNSNGRFYIPGSTVKGTLATIMHLDAIGISNSINQKFVITDSDYLNFKDFILLRSAEGTGRPPVNFLCLNENVDFNIEIKKTGDIDIPTFKKKLKTYSEKQIIKARETVKKFKSVKNKNAGANIFSFILDGYSDFELDENEYLINLGFGGGSWFKIFDDAQPPKFKTPGRKDLGEREAHTTFTFEFADELTHIGWCLLTIEEI